MILITDANILFSALLKVDSVNAQIFKDKRNVQFIAPNYIFEEIRRHWDTIVKYSYLSEKDLKKELAFYRERIKVCKLENSKLLDKAEEIVKDIDPDDVFFVALHFHTGHKIWTGDKILINGLKSKGYDICITTEELKQNLYKKSSD